MAPDFERLARRPWPMASLASSGTSFFRSAFAASCSTKAGRVRRKAAANSAQELEPLMSMIRMASSRGRGGSTPNQPGLFAAHHAAPELLLGGEQQVLVQRIGMDR